MEARTLSRINIVSCPPYLASKNYLSPFEVFCSRREILVVSAVGFVFGVAVFPVESSPNLFFLFLLLS